MDPLDLKEIEQEVRTVIDAVENIRDKSKWAAALKAAGDILVKGSSTLALLGISFTPEPGSTAHLAAAAPQFALTIPAKCELLKKCCDECKLTTAALPQVNWLGLLSNLLQTLLLSILTPPTPDPAA